MNETVAVLLAGLAGGLLGAVFFGGLWWTVHKGVYSPRPAVWFFGSLLLRMGITVAGFYLVGRGDWRRLVACLVGFVIARLLVTWLTRATDQHRPRREQGAHHAPQS